MPSVLTNGNFYLAELGNYLKIQSLSFKPYFG